MKSGKDAVIIGIPSVWQKRFTGCWWLEAYCSIHCWFVLPPIMACLLTRAAGCRWRTCYHCKPGMRRMHLLHRCKTQPLVPNLCLLDDSLGSVLRAHLLSFHSM